MGRRELAATLPELVQEAFNKLDVMAEQMQRTADAVEYREAKKDAFSKSISGLVPAAEPLILELAPDAGELWQVAGIAIKAQSDCNFMVDMGDPSRPMGAAFTMGASAALGSYGPGAESGPYGDAPFWLPGGLSIRAIFDTSTGVVAGDTCFLHVWGMRETHDDA